MAGLWESWRALRGAGGQSGSWRAFRELEDSQERSSHGLYVGVMSCPCCCTECLQFSPAAPLLRVQPQPLRWREVLLQNPHGVEAHPQFRLGHFRCCSGLWSSSLDTKFLPMICCLKIYFYFSLPVAPAGRRKKKSEIGSHWPKC